jgi:hypothetical protein
MGDFVAGDKVEMHGSGNLGKVVYGNGNQHSQRPNNVLMLMSNPAGTAPVGLLEEHRCIDLAIRGGLHRDRLQIVVSSDARYYDLQPAIRRYRPVAVHFSGHGSGTGGITLSDRDGLPLAIPPEALADTFKNLGGSVRCVVLNACATEPQAKAIARYVPCVVGTSRAIPDPLAIEFATGFYGAAADGGSIAQAYRDGRNHVDLSGWQGSQAMVFFGSGDCSVTLTA